MQKDNQPKPDKERAADEQKGEDPKIAGQNKDSGNADAVNQDGSITRNSGNPNH